MLTNPRFCILPVTAAASREKKYIIAAIDDIRSGRDPYRHVTYDTPEAARDVIEVYTGDTDEATCAMEEYETHWRTDLSGE